MRQSRKKFVPQPKSSPSLLKTCNTCFNGKIRCDRSNETGPCDRCLRLGKECVFTSRRPYYSDASRLSKRLKTGHDVPGQDGSSSSIDGQPDAGTANNADARFSVDTDFRSPSRAVAAAAFPADADDLLAPVQEWMNEEMQAQLFDLFRTRFSPRFPFVIVPENVEPQDMRQQRPHTYLAMLAVASSTDFVLQRKLGGLFNRIITAKLADGKLVSLDMLQGLLLHLAWAHFHPRPRSYTQLLYLATSIVADLRLDRPRKQQYWNVDHQDNERAGTEWSSDELRAMIGTYYLTSCSSVLLQKAQCFPYTDFVDHACAMLERRKEYPSDEFLRCIVEHQMCLEDLQKAILRNNKPWTAGNMSSKDSGSMGLTIHEIRKELETLKLRFTFPLSDCPVLELQLSALELLISQHSIPNLSLGAIPQDITTDPQIMESLYECMLASKPVITTFLAVPSGYEHYLLNLEWIVLSWSLSFAARLDLLATSPQMVRVSRKLRQRLDFTHTLRQVILRLESMVSPLQDSTGDRDIFYHFLRRARGVETWYLHHTGLDSLSTPGSATAAANDVGSLGGATLNFPYNTAPNVVGGNPVLSFDNFFTPQDMQNLDFGMFLGMQDFDSF